MGWCSVGAAAPNCCVSLVFECTATLALVCACSNGGSFHRLHLWYLLLVVDYSRLCQQWGAPTRYRPIIVVFTCHRMLLLCTLIPRVCITQTHHNPHQSMAHRQSVLSHAQRG